MTRDVLAVAVLANKRRRAISCGAERKVTATSLSLHAASSERGLVSWNAFLNRVKRMMNNDSVRREARAVVTEECASASDGSENTSIAIDELARTRYEERVRNPQRFFEEVARAFACGDMTAGDAVGELLRVGVRATQSFLKRAKKCLEYGDDLPQYSECEDGRGRPSVLSQPYEKQLARMVKYYIRARVWLSQKTILSCARTFYRDEHSSEPPSNTLEPSWFQRFIARNGIDTALYDPQDTLRLNSATAYNVRNFFERVARTAVKHGFARRRRDENGVF